MIGGEHFRRLALRLTRRDIGIRANPSNPFHPWSGFALASYPVGVEREFIKRDDAIQRTLTLSIISIPIGLVSSLNSSGEAEFWVPASSS